MAQSTHICIISYRKRRHLGVYKDMDKYLIYFTTALYGFNSFKLNEKIKYISLHGGEIVISFDFILHLHQHTITVK